MDVAVCLDVSSLTPGASLTISETLASAEPSIRSTVSFCRYEMRIPISALQVRPEIRLIPPRVGIMLTHFGVPK